MNTNQTTLSLGKALYVQGDMPVFPVWKEKEVTYVGQALNESARESYMLYMEQWFENALRIFATLDGDIQNQTFLKKSPRIRNAIKRFYLDPMDMLRALADLCGHDVAMSSCIDMTRTMTQKEQRWFASLKK